MKRSFTLLEIVFVLIVLAILSVVGSEIIANLYSNYIYTQALSDTLSRLELASETIEKRLMYRIAMSEVAIKSSNDADIKPLTYKENDYDILAWVGIANEARRGEYNSTLNYYFPGWSGFIDLNSSTKEYLITSGSNLRTADTLLQALYEKDLDDPNSAIAIAYPLLVGDPIKAYGWDTFINPTNPHTNIFFVYKQNEPTKLYFKDTSTKEIFEHYYLTASAYALVPQGSNNDYNLTLYYNFLPWKGERYKDGNSSLLITHITRFKFKRNGHGVEFMLCAKANPKYDLNTTFCVKKVVF